MKLNSGSIKNIDFFNVNHIGKYILCCVFISVISSFALNFHSFDLNKFIVMFLHHVFISYFMFFNIVCLIYRAKGLSMDDEFFYKITIYFSFFICVFLLSIKYA